MGSGLQVYSVTSYTELARNIQDHQREALIQAQTQSSSNKLSCQRLLNEGGVERRSGDCSF